MRKSVIASALYLAVCSSPCRAQSPVTGAEKALVAEAIRQLDKFAMRCQRAGAPGRGRIAWLEIVHEYDSDHVRTRKSLGHKRSGKVWHPPSDREPEPDPADAHARAALDKSWSGICRNLGAMHRRLAQQMQKAGVAKRARYHFRRALRFVPDDAIAGAALGLTVFDGAWLTPLQTTLEMRSRLVDQVVEVLRKTSFEIQEVPSNQKNLWLEKAQPGMSKAFRGFRGPSVEIWGDYDPTIVRAAVQAAERCNLLTRAMLRGNPDYRWELDVAPTFLLTASEERYHRLVDSSSRTDKKKKFAKEHLSGVWLRNGSNAVYVDHTEEPHRDIVLDTVVRVSISNAGDTRTFALTEGLGHSGCGWLLGRTLNFFLDLAGQKPPPKPTGTSASRPKPARPSDAVLIPDVGVWHSLVRQQAWEGIGPSLAELLLFTAQNTPRIARVQAWSWIHYAMARDPSLLRRLDAAADTTTMTTAAEIEKRFDADSQLKMRELEADWRRYWRTEEPRLASRRRQKESATDAWLQQISAYRAAMRRTPFGHAPGLPAEAEALAGRRDVAKALDAAIDPSDLSLSDEEQAVFGRMLFVPKKLVGGKQLHADLFVLPGSRDLLCAPVHGIIRYRSLPRGVVLYVPSVAAPKKPLPPTLFPADGASDVPERFPVKALGESAVELLDIAWDVGKAKFLGYPMSLHFGALGDHDPEASCRVTVAGKAVAVTMIGPRDGTPRKLTLPATYVCLPRRPLPGGAKIVATWTWYPERGGREERRVAFTTR